MSPRTRWRARWAAMRTDEGGFTIIEMVIALSLLALLLPVFAVTITGTTNAGSDARLRQVASAVATSDLDAARAVSAASLSNDGTAAGTVPASVNLSTTTSAVVIPQAAVTLDGHTFTSSLYVGPCYLQTSGASSGQCTTTSSSYPMDRAIAYVAWTAPTGCTSNACNFVTSTLLTTSIIQPTVNLNPNSTPPTPTGLTASVAHVCSGYVIFGYCIGTLSATITASWTASTPIGTQQAVTGYLLTATPSSGSTLTCSSNASTTSCSITGATTGSSYSLFVQANSSAGYSTASTAITVST